MITIQEIETILKEKLLASEVNIVDDAALHAGHQPGNPAYLTVYVTSKLFEGKSLVQQHKLVYDSLKDEMKEKIHALAIKTKIPN
ncbi:MAG: BolA family protein [Candidatus Caenarcaniphilales bacterium]|nr:BolA family protein [Candidatus Caenarcaniphilales bacterium]